MSDDNFEKTLTDKEAETLYNLLQKLNSEMHNRISEGDAFDTGDVSYTTITRDKKLRYLSEVYDIGVDDD